jgi:hypothetical protein
LGWGITTSSQNTPSFQEYNPKKHSQKMKVEADFSMDVLEKLTQ